MTQTLILIEKETSGGDYGIPEVESRVFSDVPDTIDTVVLDWDDICPESNHELAQGELRSALRQIQKLFLHPLVPAQLGFDRLDRVATWIRENEPEGDVQSDDERERWLELETIIGRIRRGMEVTW